jgi:tRNA U34 2-thiouridine synthase MnmA/TrmU
MVICQVSHQAVSKFIDKLKAQKPGNLVSLKTVEVPTGAGLRSGNQIDEPLLLKLIGQRRFVNYPTFPDVL